MRVWLLLCVSASGSAFVAPRHGHQPRVAVRGGVEDLFESNAPKDAADEETMRSNFANLAEVTGSEARALRIFKNDEGLIRWDPERLAGSFNAWVKRTGDIAEAADLVAKNPGLLYPQPTGGDGIEGASLWQAKAVANAMEFFRGVGK